MATWSVKRVDGNYCLIYGVYLIIHIMYQHSRSIQDLINLIRFYIFLIKITTFAYTKSVINLFTSKLKNCH